MAALYMIAELEYSTGAVKVHRMFADTLQHAVSKFKQLSFEETELFLDCNSFMISEELWILVDRISTHHVVIKQL